MSVIYFVQPMNGGPIKIGTTASLITRIRQLESDFGVKLVVLAVMDGFYAEETVLHHRFSHLHQEREWFEPGDDLLDFIREEGQPWNSEEDRATVVTYASVKIDDQLTRLIRIAAANRDVSIQELMSDILNEGVAEILGTDPITRRKPPERKPKS